MSIHLHVYARRDIGHLVSCSDDAAIATGIGNVLGNKGGVAFSLRVRRMHACSNESPIPILASLLHRTCTEHPLYCCCTAQVAGARILIVNCHLAAHDEFVDRRNADFHRICAGLPVPPPVGLYASPLLASSSLRSLPSSSQPLPASFKPLPASFKALPAASSQPSAASLKPLPASSSSGCIRGAAGMTVEPVRKPPQQQQQQQSQLYPQRLKSSLGRNDSYSARSSPNGDGSGASIAGRSGGLAGLRQELWHPHNWHPRSAPGSPARQRRASHQSGAGSGGLVSSAGDLAAARGSFDAASSSDAAAVGDECTGGCAGHVALERHDLVIWAGDLNYRIKG